MSKLSNFLISIDGKFIRYDLNSLSTTSVLDFALSNVFNVNASTPRTLTFSNTPAVDRSLTAVIYVIGDSAVTWPATISWSGGVAPLLDTNWTLIILTFVGGDCVGSSGASA